MRAGPFRVAIFDVDDVPLASPHERAWRDALVGLTDPARLHDQAGLQAAHVDMVVASLDEVRLDALAGGRLCRTPA